MRHQHKPARKHRELLHHTGQVEILKRWNLVPDGTHCHREPTSLAMDVDAISPNTIDGIGQVEILVILQGRSLSLARNARNKAIDAEGSQYRALEPPHDRINPNHWRMPRDEMDIARTKMGCLMKDDVKMHALAPAKWLPASASTGARMHLSLARSIPQ